MVGGATRPVEADEHLRPAGEPQGRRGLGRKAWPGRHRRRSAPFASRCRFSSADRSGSVEPVHQADAARSRLRKSTRWSRRTPCWSPTVARATPPCAGRARGEPRPCAQAHAVRVRGICMCVSVSVRHSRLKDFGASPPRQAIVLPELFHLSASPPRSAAAIKIGALQSHELSLFSHPTIFERNPCRGSFTVSIRHGG